MKKILPVKTVFLVLFITGTCSLGGTFSFSQSVFSQAISPEAKETFDLGVHALEQGSFDRAIKHLARAHRAAPDTPKFLYSLGFAHAQAGHEILAIIFYRAYLAVQPGAPNADGIKHDILMLQDLVEDIVQTLFKEAIAVADDLVEEDAKAAAWQEIIAAMAKAGELDLARKVAFQHPSGATWALARAATDVRADGVTRSYNTDSKQIFKLAEEVIKVEMERRSRETKMFLQSACVEGDIECFERIRREEIQWKRDWEERADYYLGYNLLYLGAYIHNAGFPKWGYDTKEHGFRMMDGCRDKWWYSNVINGNVGNNSGECEGFMIVEAPGTLRVLGDRGPIAWNPNKEVAWYMNEELLPPYSWGQIAWNGRINGFKFGDDALVDLAFAVISVKGDDINKIPGGLAQLASKLAVTVQLLQDNSMP